MNKNIHVLPTNKPTGIFELKNGLHFSIIKKIRYGEFKGFHIYITSDEEIKEGDWFISGGLVHKAIDIIDCDDDGMLEIHSEGYCNPLSLAKKIILTTDQDLIKDGVQAIDDKFLEWFVKNPSCESVEVDSFTRYNPTVYQIILPKPKQETLEELHITSVRKYGLNLNTSAESAKESAQITTDIAVKFGQFCIDLPKHHKEILRNNPDITTQELFGYFINNYYEKRS